MSYRVKLAFCWLAGVGWMANLGAGIIPQLHYHPNLIANGPMLLVLGAVFQTRKKGKPDDAS
jgi:hypothetical protein